MDNFNEEEINDIINQTKVLNFYYIIQMMQEMGVPISFGKKKNKKKNKKKKNANKLKKEELPPPDDVHPKYYAQRYRLWSLFDKGILMDSEGWFSVTPECISEHIAERCKDSLIIDCFSGCGGNTIQFAKYCNHVIAIDIDEIKLRYLKHNATIYNVNNKIECIIGDCRTILPNLKADIIFIAPPWGGPDYTDEEYCDMSNLCGINIQELFKIVFNITKKVILLCPRNCDVLQVAKFGGINIVFIIITIIQKCEIEEAYINNKCKMITAYYGDLVNKDANVNLEV